MSLTASPPARADGFINEIALRAAVRAADHGRWGDAERMIAHDPDSLDGRVLAWMDYARPDTPAGFAEISAFIEANPDWPGIPTLRRNAEARMPALPPDQVIAWFDAHPPLTMAGFNRYADALLGSGQDSERALGIIRARYVNGSFGINDERDFRLKYAAMLRPHDHWARLNRLLWDGDEEAARRMLAVVDPGRQMVALARMAMADMAPNADSLLAQVPTALLGEAGITYERLRWRRRKDMDAAALEILQNPPASLERPDLWWNEKHIMVRRLMERGQVEDAYRLAAAHGLHDGIGFVQGEFLAGWLSLQRLAKPEQALEHFTRLYDGDKSPTALSRGAFWAGRACDRLGRTEQARQWYAAAARQGSTFYGMMAAEALGEPESIPVAPTPSAAARAAYERGDLVHVTRLLAHVLGDDDNRVEQFLRRVVQQATTPDEFVLTARLATELHHRDLGVSLSRLSLQHGIVLAEAGYPLLPQRLPPQPEPALVQALIRQESSFKTDAASGAGALGLMQLMPTTAQQLARRIGLKPNQLKLTRDPDYNVRLGSTYLQDLLDRFSGSYILAIAAYNAGPGRVATWIRDYGDPRIDAVDPLDWMETIPIAETRIYVQRVLENMHVYRLRTGAPSLPMTADLKRRSSF